MMARAGKGGEKRSGSPRTPCLAPPILPSFKRLFTFFMERGGGPSRRCGFKSGEGRTRQWRSWHVHEKSSLSAAFGSRREGSLAVNAALARTGRIADVIGVAVMRAFHLVEVSHGSALANEIREGEGHVHEKENNEKKTFAHGGAWKETCKRSRAGTRARRRRRPHALTLS